MFLSPTLFFFLVFLRSAIGQEGCLDNMNLRELREFIREQESITSIPTGRIILQLMEKYRLEKDQKAKRVFRDKMEREIRSYRVLMKKSLKHFLWSETTKIATDQLIRFAFFLIDKDCHNPVKLRENLRKDYGDYWRNQNWTQRAQLLEKIKQKVLACPFK